MNVKLILMIFILQSTEVTPLGSLQKGSYDVAGAVVELVALHPRSQSPPDTSPDLNPRKIAPEWLLRVKSPLHSEPIELGCDSKEDAIDWCNTIKYYSNFQIGIVMLLIES
jgi:hypothetical protein